MGFWSKHFGKQTKVEKKKKGIENTETCNTPRGQNVEYRASERVKAVGMRPGNHAEKSKDIKKQEARTENWKRHERVAAEVNTWERARQREAAERRKAALGIKEDPKPSHSSHSNKMVPGTSPGRQKFGWGCQLSGNHATTGYYNASRGTYLGPERTTIKMQPGSHQDMWYNSARIPGKGLNNAGPLIGADGFDKEEEKWRGHPLYEAMLREV
ncbi:hypothetical protein VMCG_06691 [Cytospora schulzeri]|uniref:Uncharacterized protein n=1 Tax=Cytospora schulzeri TaxID=448051 RepID=A0A423W6W0_9PEZI|nr:hypothetical protein VMCG_06691 [Valsa malicola]